MNQHYYLSMGLKKHLVVVVEIQVKTIDLMIILIYYHHNQLLK